MDEEIAEEQEAGDIHQDLEPSGKEAMPDEPQGEEEPTDQPEEE
jgi:hypothetical protein